MLQGLRICKFRFSRENDKRLLQETLVFMAWNVRSETFLSTRLAVLFWCYLSECIDLCTSGSLLISVRTL